MGQSASGNKHGRGSQLHQRTRWLDEQLAKAIKVWSHFGRFLNLDMAQARYVNCDAGQSRIARKQRQLRQALTEIFDGAKGHCRPVQDLKACGICLEVNRLMKCSVPGCLCLYGHRPGRQTQP